jgi:hypothetical protein
MGIPFGSYIGQLVIIGLPWPSLVDVLGAPGRRQRHELDGARRGRGG